jgi:hypothetical protein
LPQLKLLCYSAAHSQPIPAGHAVANTTETVFADPAAVAVPACATDSPEAVTMAHAINAGVSVLAPGRTVLRADIIPPASG